MASRDTPRPKLSIEIATGQTARILEHALAAHKPVLAICYGWPDPECAPGRNAGAGYSGRETWNGRARQNGPGASATTKDLEHEATLAEGSHLQKLAARLKCGSTAAITVD